MTGHWIYEYALKFLTKPTMDIQIGLRYLCQTHHQIQRPMSRLTPNSPKRGWPRHTAPVNLLRRRRVWYVVKLPLIPDI